ncbi:MAG TPA: PEP/pyruvate-binding domain-containing protein, partial [Pseudomonadota bacterium]|nr:PEP/pyruvate-binding domain-containing protein [Pseudomonadota bacterium]
MRKLLDCQHCDEAGRKVQRLAKALAAGLPVLDGVVLLPEEPLPTAAELSAALCRISDEDAAPPVTEEPLPTAAELSAALCRISDEDAAPPVTEEPRFVVRSSAQAEDQLGRSAAGLFLSLTNVSLDGVRAAAAEVRASGHSALILDYCGQYVPVAVLIQPMVQAERLGVLFLLPDGSACVEERPAHSPEWSDVCPGHLPTDDTSALLHGAR